MRAGSDSGGRTLDYWVAAVPVVWNIAPNGHDAMEHGHEHGPGYGHEDGWGMDMNMGTTLPTSQTVVHTVVYRRYSPNWRKPLPNAASRAPMGC